VVRPTSRKLTAEEESSVAEWIRANPCIYDKGDLEHKDRGKRARLFQEKAEQLGGLQAKDLQTWYTAQRNSYGKLVKRAPSGAGAVPLTDRQTWLLGQFDFLRSHMVAIPVRSGVDLQAARRRKLKFDLPAAAAAMADDEETQTCSQPVTTPEPESDASTADVLRRQRSELQQLLEERAAPDEVGVSILQLKSLMRQMTPNYRDRFINKTLHAALNFVALSRQQLGVLADATTSSSSAAAADTALPAVPSAVPVSSAVPAVSSAADTAVPAVSSAADRYTHLLTCSPSSSQQWCVGVSCLNLPSPGSLGD